jgi:hypothetical protein
MMTVIDQSRLEAFSDAISDARISTLRSRRRVLQVLGEAGCGKTTLALAYAAKNCDTRIIGPEWHSASQPAALHPAMRASLVIVDEPLFFPRLSEFLDMPGDLVVLLMQHTGDIPLDVMLSNSLRFDLPHWTRGIPAIYK